ncbi:MAG: prepilin-type N-terminal cleavage/methylation domain-containing protein [Thermoguttaceae bacterium]|nr:prepilin-type N-terminal cleavage/methylation domain-containing protein [Thermoguttaceae bacterium]
MTGVKVSFRTWSARSLRRGFTLTELLLVIIIIAILAAMTMTVQRSAVESTRRERTIATIRKIDAALTSAYEKYQYRKPDVCFWLDEIEKELESDLGFKSKSQEGQNEQIIRKLFYWIYHSQAMWLENIELYSKDENRVPLAPYILRTIMLRERLLIDFPDSLAEVVYQAHFNSSPVQLAYQKKMDELQSAYDLSRDHDISADLLYLIVMNTSPETRGTFLDREAADTNNNGIPEFIDGWGNPIRFIRWAPGIPESDRQPTLEEGDLISRYRQLGRRKSQLELEDGALGSEDYVFYTYFDEDYPGLLESSADPFDPVGSMDGWLLTPLIYSAGPDREYGLGIDGLSQSPFDKANSDIGLGDWNGDDEGNTYSRDNITNHNLE